MKRILFILPLITTLGLLTACSTAPKQPTESSYIKVPAWVTNPPHATQNQIFAVGTAHIQKNELQLAIQTAENIAKAKLKHLQQANPTPNTSPTPKKSTPNNDLQFGLLETTIRQRILSQLQAPTHTQPAITLQQTFINPNNQTVSVLATTQKKQPLTQTQLMAVNKQLRKFIHVSSNGSRLTQLLALLPALPLLEQRQQIIAANPNITHHQPPLVGDKLASQLDQQIHLLFDNFVTNVEATTQEAEANESDLIQALKNQGYQISERLPDLRVRYYIESETIPAAEGNPAETTVTLTNDIELLNQGVSEFANLSSDTTGTGKTEQQAKQQAFNQLATQITDKIITQLITNIKLFNKNNHLKY